MGVSSLTRKYRTCLQLVPYLVSLTPPQTFTEYSRADKSTDVFPDVRDIRVTCYDRDLDVVLPPSLWEPGSHWPRRDLDFDLALTLGTLGENLPKSLRLLASHVQKLHLQFSLLNQTGLEALSIVGETALKSFTHLGIIPYDFNGYHGLLCKIPKNLIDNYPAENFPSLRHMAIDPQVFPFFLRLNLRKLQTLTIDIPYSGLRQTGIRFIMNGIVDWQGSSRDRREVMVYWLARVDQTFSPRWPAEKGSLNRFIERGSKWKVVEVPMNSAPDSGHPLRVLERAGIELV